MRVFVLDDESGEVSAAAERELGGAEVEKLARWSEWVLRDRLASSYSLILLAWDEKKRGSEALALLRELAPDTPRVVVAPRGISTAGCVLAMRTGAADVVGPEDLGRLATVVESALGRTRSGKRMRAALPNGDGFFRWAMETSNLGVWVIDAAGRTKFVNKRMTQLLRCAPADVIGHSVLDFVDEPDHAEIKRRVLGFQQGETTIAQVRYRRLDGTHFLALLESTPIIDDDARFAGGLAMVMDITAWREADEVRTASDARVAAVEAQLRQSQKMEAVGRLAGGITHDFNNMLSVILGYGDTLLERVSGLPDVREDIEEIMTAGRRAADLTRQLLLFSRQHVVRPSVVDLSALIDGMRKMIERIVGEDIQLEFVATAFATPPLVRVDKSGIEQVVLNLVVNARDAMPTGGRLVLSVVAEGESLAVRVQDSGCGMDEATIARAFDPFFTTKEQGKGTGLGLSTAYGIVEQAGGTIRVESEPGAGATFVVVLPRATGPKAVHPVVTAATPIVSLGARATILLVEDEDQVRAVTRRALERQGYRVVEARSPLQALDRDPADVDLLLTDVVMPQMSGPELARRLIDARPSLKVLFMSGYNDDNVVRHGVSLASVAYLQKPFSPSDLSQKIREVLAQPAA